MSAFAVTAEAFKNASPQNSSVFLLLKLDLRITFSTGKYFLSKSMLFFNSDRIDITISIQHLRSVL